MSSRRDRPSNRKSPRSAWQLVFLGGGEVRIFPHEMGPILRHPLIMLFYLAITVVNLAVGAAFLTVGKGEPMLSLRLPLVCLSMLLGLLNLVICIRLVAWFQRRRAVARIHVTPPLLLSILCGQTTLAAMQRIFLDTSLPPLWLMLCMIIAYQAVGEAFLGFLRHHADDILQDVRSHHPRSVDTPTPPQPATFVAGNRSFPVESVLRLSAQGNYVRVVTDSAEALVPGPLSDLAATLPERLGALVHRSDWVATRAVTAAYRDGRNTVLELGDGTTVRVASSREALIRDWLAQFDIEPARRRKSAR